MPKLIKSHQIELWDTERIGNHVEFHYITADMLDDEPVLKMKITSSELEDFILDNEMNEHQTDVDDFKAYNAFDHLIDNWDEVVQVYWEDYLQPKMETSYREAIAYIESYISKLTRPVTDFQLLHVVKKVENSYGVIMERRDAS